MLVVSYCVTGSIALLISIPAGHASRRSARARSESSYRRSWRSVLRHGRFYLPNQLEGQDEAASEAVELGLHKGWQCASVPSAQVGHIAFPRAQGRPPPMPCGGSNASVLFSMRGFSWTRGSHSRSGFFASSSSRVGPRAMLQACRSPPIQFARTGCMPSAPTRVMLLVLSALAPESLLGRMGLVA
jgi:hypothetical protein